MRILHREWDDVLEGVAPPLLDLAELERLVTAEHSLLREFLFLATQSSSPLSSLAGHLFEGLAHNTLRHGGTFRTRSLSSSQTEDLEIPPLDEILIAGSSFKGMQSQVFSSSDLIFILRRC